ncbi:MAG: hypothetical protein WDN75_02615 [Bacteroidota bacterium]
MPVRGEYKADPIAKRNGRGGSVLFGLIIIVILGSFTWSALFTKGCAGWGLYGFLSPFYAILPGIALGSSVSWLTILISYLVAFPILKLILGRTAWGQGISQQMADSAKKNRSGGWSSGGGWFIGGGGGSGWGGGGGGGFSGGGGSFGGGGSSGSW